MSLVDKSLVDKSLVDERLDLVVYSCGPCGKEVGSPMPANMRCLECNRPMPPVRVRSSAEHPWSPWKRSSEPKPIQAALFEEESSS